MRWNVYILISNYHYYKCDPRDFSIKPTIPNMFWNKTIAQSEPFASDKVLVEVPSELLFDFW